MASPFLGFANSTITFTIPDGTLTQDADGNAKPGERTVMATATLKTLPNVKANRPKDVSEAALLLEGTLITVNNAGKKSMLLPAGVLADNWFSAVFSGQSGYFFLMQPINPPYGRQGIGALIEKSAGTKIWGWFQISRN